MKVAALYDIHGNLPALEAVLEEIRTAGVDRIVVGGDVVPGPMPRESMAALLALPVPVDFIHGNGERDVLSVHRGDPPARVPERFRPAIRWVADQLPSGHLAALAGWPMTFRLEIPGLGDVLFCHATPRGDHEIFTRLTPESRLKPVFEPTKAAVVVCGHTHMPFDRTVGSVRVVNAGSLGMPFGAPGAYWLMLGPGISARRTDYDLASATRRIRATAYPLASEFEIVQPRADTEMLELFESAALR